MAKWLRILGYDTSYSRSAEKSRLVIQSLQEQRILITKNTAVGSRRGIRVVQVRSDFFKEQLRQVLNELKLSADKKDFFRRCVLCNEPLKPAEKQTVKAEVPEYVYAAQEEFVRCPACGRVYWPGTHWGNAEEIVREVEKD